MKSSTKKTALSRKTPATRVPAKKTRFGAMRSAKAIVRDSPIHGRGVVARRPIAAGERICEYHGERIGWPEALRRHPHDPEQPFHTFYFSVDDDTVIDGNVGGNYSRFMNHSCEPNCEAEMVEEDGFALPVLTWGSESGDEGGKDEGGGDEADVESEEGDGGGRGMGGGNCRSLHCGLRPPVEMTRFVG